MSKRGKSRQSRHQQNFYEFRGVQTGIFGLARKGKPIRIALHTTKALNYCGTFTSKSQHLFLITAEGLFNLPEKTKPKKPSRESKVVRTSTLSAPGKATDTSLCPWTSRSTLHSAPAHPNPGPGDRNSREGKITSAASERAVCRETPGTAKSVKTQPCKPVA